MEYLWPVLVGYFIGSNLAAYTIHAVEIAAYSVNAPEPLDQTNRIPVQVIVDDLVAVLKIQTFRENVGCDDRSEFGFAGCEPVFGICLWRESTDDARFTFVAAENDLDFSGCRVRFKILK